MMVQILRPHCGGKDETMKLCMNEMTFGRNGTLLTHIEDCRRHGISQLEIRKGDLMRCLRAGHTLAEIRAALDENGVTSASFNSIDNFTFNDARGAQLLKENAELLLSTCRQLGCSQMEVIASFNTPTGSKSEIFDETVRGLTLLSDLAARYGVRLALEFMATKGSSVQTLSECLDIVRAVGRDNVGILLDTWHFYAMGSTFESLEQTKGREIFMLHVSDCPAHAPGEAQRTESLLPGDGVIDLKRLLQTLDNIGYDGVVSAEIFAPEITALPPEKMLPLVRERMERMLHAAGITYAV